MKNWIRRQMRAERRRTTITIAWLAGIMGLFALLCLGFVAEPYFAGVARLDSQEKLDRFAQGRHSYGTLTYNSAVEVGSFSLSGEKGSTDYTAWKLIGDGYIVLYCTSGDFAGVGDVYAAVEYQDFSDEILADFAPGDENAYVLFQTEPPFEIAAATGLMAVLALLALWINRLPYWDRRSYLGKQIAALGDYDKLVAQINQQAASPRFQWRGPCVLEKASFASVTHAQSILTYHGCTVLEDWILLDLSKQRMLSAHMELIPITQLEDIRITPHQGAEPLAKCDFVIRDKAPQTIYMQAAAGARLEALKETILEMHETA